MLYAYMGPFTFRVTWGNMSSSRNKHQPFFSSGILWLMESLFWWSSLCWGVCACTALKVFKGVRSSFEGHVRAAKSSAAAVLNNQVCTGICSGQKCKVTQHVYILEFIITLIYLLYIWSRVLKDTKTHLFHVVARLIVRLISFETSVHYGDASISYRELLNWHAS